MLFSFSTGRAPRNLPISILYGMQHSGKKKHFSHPLPCWVFSCANSGTGLLSTVHSSSVILGISKAGPPRVGDVEGGRSPQHTRRADTKRTGLPRCAFSLLCDCVVRRSSLPSSICLLLSKCVAIFMFTKHSLQKSTFKYPWRWKGKQTGYCSLRWHEAPPNIGSNLLIPCGRWTQSKEFPREPFSHLNKMEMALD